LKKIKARGAGDSFYSGNAVARSAGWRYLYDIDLGLRYASPQALRLRLLRRLNLTLQ